MRSLPLDDPKRRDLSLRAGERYEVARELRALASGRVLPTVSANECGRASPSRLLKKQTQGIDTRSGV
jgi:hypothetical protein